jgi:hypothetical protein
MNPNDRRAEEGIREAERKEKRKLEEYKAHLKEQKDANESGFFKDTYFHKNSKFNLVTLCKSCHKKIDTGELIINGYKQSTSGLFFPRAFRNVASLFTLTLSFFIG